MVPTKQTDNERRRTTRRIVYRRYHVSISFVLRDADWDDVAAEVYASLAEGGYESPSVTHNSSGLMIVSLVVAALTHTQADLAAGAAVARSIPDRVDGAELVAQSGSRITPLAGWASRWHADRVRSFFLKCRK